MDDGKNDSQLRRKEHFLKRILPCFPPGRRRQPPKSTTMNGKVAPQQDVSMTKVIYPKNLNIDLIRLILMHVAYTIDCVLNTYAVEC